MTTASLIKLFETVGIPVVAAAAAGYALWWLIKWITSNLKNELREQHDEIDEEMRDTRETLSKQIKDLNVIIIRLIDRVRVLEINFIH